MRIFAAVLASVLAGACTQSSMSPAQPASVNVPVRIQSEPRAGGQQAAGAPRTASEHNLGTHLTGNEEVPARDTGAQGQAIFRINEDGSAISYKINVANIENVTQSHIHLAAAGVNGGTPSATARPFDRVLEATPGEDVGGSIVAGDRRRAKRGLH